MEIPAEWTVSFIITLSYLENCSQKTTVTRLCAIYYITSIFRDPWNRCQFAQGTGSTLGRKPGHLPTWHRVNMPSPKTHSDTNIDTHLDTDTHSDTGSMHDSNPQYEAVVLPTKPLYNITDLLLLLFPITECLWAFSSCLSNLALD